jgi:hypothetical protein
MRFVRIASFFSIRESLILVKYGIVYIKYKFENQNGEILYFEQRALTRSGFYIDIEQGYSQINEIENYEIYYRTANDFHWFVWNHREYSIKIKSNIRLSNDEIVQIIQGIKIK